MQARLTCPKILFFQLPRMLVLKSLILTCRKNIKNKSSAFFQSRINLLKDTLPVFWRKHPQIAGHIAIPILHIADATIAELQANRIKKVALLGTKYTMTQEFYKQRIIDSGIDVWIPNEQDIETVNQIIFDELCHGKILEASKERFIAVIQEAIAAGVEGVILGCTEIGLLIQQKDVTIPVFDTTEIHSQKAVEQALEE